MIFRIYKLGKQKGYRQKWIRNLGLLLRSLGFYLVNFFFRRRLKVYGVHLSNILILKGNKVELLWRVKGCHKIRIEGIGTFPGNVQGITCSLEGIQTPVEITFYGVKSQILEVLQMPKEHCVSLKSKFITKSCLSHLHGTDIPDLRLRLRDLQLSKSRGCDHLRLDLLKQIRVVDIPAIKIQFPNFNIKDYHPERSQML